MEKTLDYGRRSFATASDFCARFDEGGQDLGIGGFLAVRDNSGAISVPRREPTMGLAGCLKVKSSSKTFSSKTIWPRSKRPNNSPSETGETLSM